MSPARSRSIISPRLNFFVAAFLCTFIRTIEKCSARLTFQALPNAPPCADGSPFGIYVEDDVAQRDNTKHVIVFKGGGACTSPEDCDADYKREPFKFSTRTNPHQIDGDTILSTNPNINPLLHNYTRTFVPYCSQDFFLGDINRGKIGNFVHGGSAIMQETLEAWQRHILPGNSSQLQHVVVAAISAGALGALNHMDDIRSVVPTTANLQFILDSPTVLADIPYEEKDFRAMMVQYVDFEQYPYCDPTHPASLLYSRLSVLPCCLSTHCMLREHPALASLKSGDDTLYESMLIVDSAYDFMALLANFAETEFTSELDFRKDTQAGWSLLETGGMRRQRALETTVSATKSKNQGKNGTVPETASKPRLQWMFSACVAHTFLVPSREFLWEVCEEGDYSEEDIDFTCSEDGVAFEMKAEDTEIEVQIWRTVDSWRQLEFNGQTLRQVINDFVSIKRTNDPNSAHKGPSASSTGEYAIDLRLDRCWGPGCVPEQLGDFDQPSCEAMVHVPSTFKSVDKFLISFWALLALTLICSLFARAWSVRLLTRLQVQAQDGFGSSMQKRAIRKSTAPDLRIRGLKACATGDKHIRVLLNDVNLDLPGGTINALVGASGSGKSTLLRCLSQLNFGLKISMEEGSEMLSLMEKSWLRQADSLGWENMKPCELLLLNSKIYGASTETTCGIYRLLENMFRFNDGESDFNPFLHTNIADLSGGQRRLVSIANTMLLDTSFLLLDEPLSGLDEPSARDLMTALGELSRYKDITVLVVVHQPSDAVLDKFDRVIAMNSGSVVYQESVEHARSSRHHPVLENLIRQQRTLQSIEQTISVAISNKDLEQTKDEKKSTATSSVANDNSLSDVSASSQSPTSKDKTDDDDQSSDTLPDSRNVSLEKAAIEESVTENNSLCKTFLQEFQRAIFMMIRLHKQYGWELLDIIITICAFTVVSGFLLMEPSFAVRILLMTVSMISLPMILFSNKGAQFAKTWLNHRTELDDRLIGVATFQLVSFLQTATMLFVALVIATVPAYLILDFPFETFLVQCMYSCLTLTSILLFYRMLGVAFRGDPVMVVKAGSLYMVFSFLFSSGPMAS